MQSASEDNKPFLVELIHAVVSTVETRHRHPIPPFTVTQPTIYISFSSSVLLHFSRLNVHTRRLVPGPSVSLQTLLMWFWEVGRGTRRKVEGGGEGWREGGKGRSIMLLGQ